MAKARSSLLTDQLRQAIDDSGLTFFRNQPLAENPVPAFFGGEPIAAQPSVVLDDLASQFRNQFSLNVEQLITLDRTAAIPIGGGASSGALIAGVGVDIDDIFYAVESAANDSDDPALRAENTPLIAAIAKTLSATKVVSEI